MFKKKTKRIGKVRAKSRFVPVYKNIADKDLGWKTETNIKWAQGKAGVYLIKENGNITYIGAGSNVYKNALRHFEKRKERSGQRYDKRLDTHDYTIRIVLTNTTKQAFALETALIKAYKPRDNKIQLEVILEAENIKMLNEYNGTKAETPYWEVEAPF